MIGKVVLYGSTFLAGAVVGGLIVRHIAIKKVEGAIGGAIDSSLGKGTWYGGLMKGFANMFVEAS